MSLWPLDISGWRLQNFEIRVGLNDTDLGNNAICYKQLETMASGATMRFKCSEELFGSWVSVNKTATVVQYEHLQLIEVGVYDSKYSAQWYGFKLVIYF